jgi:hypothetical protein
MTPGGGVRMDEHATAGRLGVSGQRVPVRHTSATSALTGRPADISLERKSDPVNGHPFCLPRDTPARVANLRQRLQSGSR